jgi:hypothetical protein
VTAPHSDSPRGPLSEWSWQVLERVVRGTLRGPICEGPCSICDFYVLEDLYDFSPGEWVAP